MRLHHTYQVSFTLGTQGSYVRFKEKKKKKGEMGNIFWQEDFVQQEVDLDSASQTDGEGNTAARDQ